MNLSDLQRRSDEWRIAHCPVETLQDAVLRLAEETGELAKAVRHGEREKLIDAIGDIVLGLTEICYRTNINLAIAVERTADEVFKRDYLRYPYDGRTK